MGVFNEICIYEQRDIETPIELYNLIYPNSVVCSSSTKDSCMHKGQKLA